MKNLGVYISLGIFAIGMILGAGKLIAQTTTNDNQIEKLENKVLLIKEKSDKQEVNQTAMEKQLDRIDDKLDKVVGLLVKEKK